MKVTQTNILVAVNIIIFIAMSGAVIYTDVTPDQFLDAFGFSGDAVAEGKWWTVFTSLFVHGDITHILVNSIALFFFGNALEKKVKMRRYFLIYFAGGIIGEFATMSFYSPSTPLIGASGAIFALMGAAMVMNPFEIVAIPVPPFIVPVVYGAVLLSVLNIGSLIIGHESQISYAAHIGGLFTGVLLVLGQKKSKIGLLITLIVLAITLAAPILLSNYLPESFQNIAGFVLHTGYK